MKTGFNNNIFLVIPPSVQIPTPGREFLLLAPFEGVSHISTILENADFNVNIIDCRFLQNPLEEAVATCLKINGIIGVATFMDSFVFLERFTERIKQLKPELPVILGGSFVSSSPSLIMNNLKADIAVLGEGELTTLEIMQRLSDGKGTLSDIQGICYKNNGELVFNRPRPQIEDLDTLPTPNLSLWPKVKRDQKIEKIPFSTNRGCLYNCSFCYRTIRKLSLKSPEKIRAELLELKGRYGIKFIFLNDLTFISLKERIKLICEIFKECNLSWACMARIDEMNTEVLKKMKDSHCEGIWPGIESVDQSILDRCHKGITVEQIRFAIRQARRIGIEVRGLFIIGLPGETKKSLEKMLRFIEDEDIIPLVKYLTPFPGTEIYRIAKERGLISNEVDYLRRLGRRKVASVDDEIINLTGLPEEELRGAFRRFWQITRKKTPVDSKCPG